MATTENLYTGDGTTVSYSFTFPYLNIADVKASLDGVDTNIILANATTAEFTGGAPGNGVAIRIYRSTDSETISADFFPGAAVKSADLNTNFDQVLYVGQEAKTAVENTQSTAEGAVTTANNAVTTANSAVTTANTATTTANTATTTANSAVTTANSAVTTANTATTTANSAVTTANSAVTTANAASATATAAQNAIASAAFYTPVANVAGIPGSPNDNDRVEVSDSTGIQSFSPLTGYPSGFTGSSGLTARIQYSSSGSTWNWVDYFANDPEDRYYTKTAGTTNATNITTKMPLAGGTFSGAVSFDDNVIIKGDSTNGSGKLTLNCENNSHGVHIKGPPHSAAASYTLTLPNNTGTNGQFLSTNGSGVTSWSTMNQVIIADGGNFDSGSSLASTTTSYDGGSFD